MDPMRFSNLGEDELRARLFEIVLADPLLSDALKRARDLNLPQWRIVSGAIYNTVWNVLTGKPSGYGLKDIDLFYFDRSDLSYEAEDREIKRGEKAFSALSIPVEIKNQARVHLWFKQRFGIDYPKLTSCEDGIGKFASKTHSVGIRLCPDDTLDLHAPFGLRDIFSMRVTPNRCFDNKNTHEEKAKRAVLNWPQVEVVPW